MQNTFLLQSALRRQQSYSISYKFLILRILNALLEGKLFNFQSRVGCVNFYCHNLFFHVNGSLENIQVDLFEKEICGGLKLSIFQYNILQFQSSTLGGIVFLVYPSNYL